MTKINAVYDMSADEYNENNKFSNIHLQLK